MTLAPPVVGPPRPLTPPKVAEAKLRNGLRVLVVRKATVPRVELRLLAPTSGRRNIAAERVLAKTLLSGTDGRTSFEIAQELQRLGATLGAGIGADHFQVSGSVLAANLEPFLDLIGEALSGAVFPPDEIAVERMRVAQEVQIARSQPQAIAAEALRKRMFGRHRYAAGLPEPEAVARVGRAALRGLIDTRVATRGGTLVVVGDVKPERAVELLGATLGKWRTQAKAEKVEPAPEQKRGPTLIVDRPGSVQTNIRLAGRVPDRRSEESYAVDLANTIFGGYFISRLTENLRERRGYTYTPYSQVAHQQAASFVEIAADVGAEVTAPALVETRYELGRMIALDVEPDELESAKRYRTGIQALRIQSQAGLAGTLAALAIHGLDIDYLRSYPKKITALTAADVRDAAVRYLAPSRFVTLLVGDASQIERPLSSIDDIEVQA